MPLLFAIIQIMGKSRITGEILKIKDSKIVLLHFLNIVAFNNAYKQLVIKERNKEPKKSDPTFKNLALLISSIISL